ADGELHDRCLAAGGLDAGCGECAGGGVSRSGGVVYSAPRVRASVDFSARQRRAVHCLAQLELGDAMTGEQFLGRVLRMDWMDVELLIDAGFLCWRQERKGMLYWLSARGRRYAASLRHEKEDATCIAGRQTAPGRALQGPEHG